jgi:DNA-binding NarL/FixJ family response regulator
MEPSRATGSAAIAVLVVDSNQTERQLLVSALRRHANFRVTACGLEVAAVWRIVESSSVQVAVINVDNPRNGAQDLSLVRKLHLAYPEVSKVVLVHNYDRDSVVNAFRSGALGIFCLSEHPFRILCKSIQCVHAGQVWANSEQLRYLLQVVMQVPSLRTVNALGFKLLTRREEQVVALVADGLSNREVAEELNLSESTIKKYLFGIFDKLGISSRVELVLYAVSHGSQREAEWLATANL